MLRDMLACKVAVVELLRPVKGGIMIGTVMVSNLAAGVIRQNQQTVMLRATKLQ
jgi:hypothetical protein